MAGQQITVYNFVGQQAANLLLLALLKMNTEFLEL